MPQAWAVVGGLALAIVGGARAQAPRAADLSGLPVIERPVARRPGPLDGTLAVLLTGDGAWAAGDRGIAEALRADGVPVVGFDTPSYLRVPRTPDGAGADLQRLLTHYLQAWHCERAIIIGYSRGADLVPFMVARLPAALRERLDAVALIGLSKVASFQYQPTDLFADALRFNDYPVLPELQRLRGLRLLCLSGERERGSLCPELDPDLARVTTHGGSHVVSRQAAGAVEQAIVAAVAPPPITRPRPTGARRR
jgi:type IV secretory pathway VirJ component